MDIQFRISQQSDQYAARRVAMHVLEMSQEELVMGGYNTIGENHRSVMDEMMKSYDAGVPLAYVLGYELFCGAKFVVDERVLIPRPETEEMVMLASVRLRDNNHSTLLLDMGTGSGCVGISTMLQLSSQCRDSIQCVLCDVSQDALEVAEYNRSILCDQGAVHIQQVDVTQLADDDQGLDVLVANVQEVLILANLPYIPEGYSGVEYDVRTREPSLALYSGEDGLDHYRALVEWAVTHGGDQSWVLWMEMMSDQTSILIDSSGLSANQRMIHQTFHPNIVIVELAIPSSRQ